MAWIDRDQHLGERIFFLTLFTDSGNRKAAGKHGRHQVERNRDTGALPVTDRQHPPGLFDLSRVSGDVAIGVIAADNRQRYLFEPALLDFSIGELRHRAVDHNMLAVRARDCNDERVIADAAVFAAPGGHIGHRVGPADADAACVRRLPAEISAAHPVVVVAERHDTHAIFARKLHCTVHAALRIEVSHAKLAVPAFKPSASANPDRFLVRLDVAFFDVGNDAWEAVDAVGIDAVHTVVGKNFRRFERIRFVKAFFDQDAVKFCHQFVIRDSHMFSSSNCCKVL